MKKERVVTQQSFDALLAWLGSNRDEAGQNYERIRIRLIKIFACRGCNEAEDLADETINRVIAKVQDLAKTYEGDPALYFYGVAQKVHLESLRKVRTPAVPPPPVIIEDESDLEFECLERCMETLSPENKSLVLDYYQEEKQAKIEHRKKLADELGIALNALRIRAHRIRVQLQQCVVLCLEERTVH
jgi:DNA-directed RNA polymerase specialized sigma24 family protein